MRRLSGPTCLALLAAWPAATEAQIVVTGRVTGDGRPVALAEIRVEPRGLLASTDDSGTYRVLVPEPGVVVLSVRAVGFHPNSRRVLLAVHDTAIVDFILGRAPQQLDSITVAAPEVVVSAKMQAVEERRRLGRGYFYTREQLEKWEHRTLGNVLAMIGGLTTIHRSVGCGGGLAIAGSRSGPPRLIPEAYGCVPEACYAPIFLDGIPYWLPGNRRDPPPDINRVIRVHDLETIEVYRGEATAPIQYNVSGAGCGVVLLWTRVGGWAE